MAESVGRVRDEGPISTLADRPVADLDPLHNGGYLALSLLPRLGAGRSRHVRRALALGGCPHGAVGLTFRALAAHLATGSGAIYWHVANKDDLLAAAIDEVIARIMANAGEGLPPKEAIRALAVGVFDAIAAHPWVGTDLTRAPWQSAMMRIFEAIGERIQALGVPERAQFDCASALVNYILGVAGQNAAHARLQVDETDRTTFLASVAARWVQFAPEGSPFVRQVAAQLAGHDDREQFLAGIDLILAGIGTLDGYNGAQ